MKHKRLALSLVLLLAFFAHKVYTQTEDLECIDDDACDELFICVDGSCTHKGLFPLDQLTVREILCIALIMIIGGPAHGLGAGSIMMPILILGFNYEANKSTMIMYSIILGGSFGNFLNNAFRINPATNKPVVDYDMVLIIMPLLLAHVAIGVVLKIMSPSILVLIGLIILEASTLKKLWRNARERHEREKKAATTPAAQPLLPKKEEIEMVQSQGQADSILPPDAKEEEKQKFLNVKEQRYHEIDGIDDIVELPKTFETKTMHITRQETREEDRSNELKWILAEDKRLFPISKWVMIVLNLGWIVGITLLRGTDKLKSALGFYYCGPRYWGLYFLQYLGGFIFAWINTRMVGKRIEIKRKNGFTSEADFLINKDVIPRLCKVASVAGVIAGFLGIGGGVIMSPYLLACGCPPGTMGAVCAFLIVLNSAMATFFSIMMSDHLNLNEVYFFFAITLIGSFIISRIITSLVRRFNKPSLLLWIMIFIVGSSLVVMPIFAVWRSISTPSAMLNYRSVC